MSNETFSDAATIRIAERPPAMCSACFGQYPDRHHIDFGASWDGPVLDGAHRVSIDELIICENCIEIAASLFGLTADGSIEIARILKATKQTAVDLVSAHKYIELLEAAVAAKPKGS